MPTVCCRKRVINERALSRRFWYTELIFHQRRVIEDYAKSLKFCNLYSFSLFAQRFNILITVGHVRTHHCKLLHIWFGYGVSEIHLHSWIRLNSFSVPGLICMQIYAIGPDIISWLITYLQIRSNGWQHLNTPGPLRTFSQLFLKCIVLHTGDCTMHFVYCTPLLLLSGNEYWFLQCSGFEQVLVCRHADPDHTSHDKCHIFSCTSTLQMSDWLMPNLIFVSLYSSGE